MYNRTLPRMRERQAYLLGTLTATERKAIFSALEKLELAAGDHAFLP